MTSDNSKDYIYQFAAPAGFSGRGAVPCFVARVSGLYCSEDGGLTWKSALDSFGIEEIPPILAVALSTDFEHDPSLFAGFGGGILRSIDGGQTWEIAAMPSPPPVVSNLTLSPDFIQDGLIFASTLEDGVLCSLDRGRHWNAWNFGLLDLNTLCMAISPGFAVDETLFVGTQSGIFRSTNGGRSWREVDLPMGYDPVLSLAISPDFSRDATLFAGTENHGLWCSNDSGQSWQRLGRSVLRQPINSILLAPDFPARTDVLVLHGGILLATDNGGRSWHRWRADVLVRKDVTAVLVQRGFKSRAPALVGYANGTIQRVRK